MWSARFGNLKSRHVIAQMVVPSSRKVGLAMPDLSPQLTDPVIMQAEQMSKWLKVHMSSSLPY